MGIGGQQVVGVVDALHTAVGSGYPDDPATQVGNIIGEVVGKMGSLMARWVAGWQDGWQDG